MIDRIQILKLADCQDNGFEKIRKGSVHFTWVIIYVVKIPDVYTLYGNKKTGLNRFSLELTSFMSQRFLIMTGLNQFNPV